MKKGKIFRDKGNLVSNSYSYYGEIIQNGLEFKLLPLKVPIEEHISNNPRVKDPYIIYIKKLLAINRISTEDLKVKIINDNTWEITIDN